MIRLDADAPGFAADFAALVEGRREADGDVARDVAAILRAVREEGDAAVRAFTQRFDGHDPDEMSPRPPAPEAAAPEPQAAAPAPSWRAYEAQARRLVEAQAALLAGR